MGERIHLLFFKTQKNQIKVLLCVNIECNGVAAVAALHKSERNKSTELFPESAKWITASHRVLKTALDIQKSLQVLQSKGKMYSNNPLGH